MISLAWRDILPTNVVNELDQLVAGIRSYLFTEHTQEGSHSDVTADSLTVREGGSIRVMVPAGADDPDDETEPRLEMLVDPEDPTNVLLRVPASLELDTANPFGNMRFGYHQSFGIDSTRWNGWIVRPDGVEQSQTSPGPRWAIVSGVDGLSAMLGIADDQATPWKFRYVTGIGYVLTPGAGAKAFVGVSLGTKGSTSSERFTEVAADSVYGHNGFFRSARTVADGEWQDYTPVLAGTSNPTGFTITGRYALVGKTCHFQIQVLPGASWSPGTGSYSISLPTAMVGNLSGTGYVVDATDFSVYPALVANGAVDKMIAYFDYPGVIMQPGTPITHADGDVWRFSGTFEIE